MADLNADRNALVVIDGNDSGQAVDVAVQIDAEASVGDAAGSRYRARLHTGAAGAGQGKPAVVGEVPIHHMPVFRAVLAHGRDENAVPEADTAQRQRPEERR